MERGIVPNIGTTFVLSNLDISHFSVRDEICGYLDYLRWVVVKALYVGANLGKSIDIISSYSYFH